MGKRPLDTGDYHFLFKINIVGDPKVGKTCLVERFREGVYPGNVQQFADLGISVGTISIQSHVCKLQFWEPYGFFQAPSNHYYHTKGVVVVYDVTNQDSFRNVEERLSVVFRDNDREDVPVLLVGAKCDLKNSSTSVVDSQVAKEFADSSGYFFIETSALDAFNVREAFEMLVSAILRRKLEALTSARQETQRQIQEQQQLHALERTRKARKKKRSHCPLH
jgi:Ras-related protein Rab-1A